MLMSLACVQDSPDDTNRIYGKDSVHLPRLNKQRLVRRDFAIPPAIDERQERLIGIGERGARHPDKWIRKRSSI